MKRDNVNYLLVGSFVLLMGIVLLYALYRITGQAANGEPFVTHFANVAGIKAGSPVTLDGYAIGNVASIEPVRRDGRNAYRVTLQLREAVGIPADSRARITAPGMLAAPLVDIRSGQSQEMLAAGAELPGEAGGSLSDSVAGLAGDLRALANDGIRPLVEQIAGRIDRVGGSLEENLPATLRELRSAMTRLNATAGRVDDMFSAQNRQHMEGMLKNGHDASLRIAQLSQEILGASRELEGLLKDSRVIVAGSGQDLQQSLRHADALLHQLEAAGRNLNEFSRTIRNNPAALIQSRPPVDAATAQGEKP